MTQNDLKGFRFRESTRAPFETEVKLRFDRFGGAVSGFSADISMEGMFVRTTEPKPVGTLVQFEFSLGEDGELIQGLGDVVWVRTRQLAPSKPPGMGIQFRYIDPHSRELIFKIVDKYLKEAKQEGVASPAGSSAPEASRAIPADQAGGAPPGPPTTSAPSASSSPPVPAAARPPSPPAPSPPAPSAPLPPPSVSVPPRVPMPEAPPSAPAPIPDLSKAPSSAPTASGGPAVEPAARDTKGELPDPMPLLDQVSPADVRRTPMHELPRAEPEEELRPADKQRAAGELFVPDEAWDPVAAVAQGGDVKPLPAATPLPRPAYAGGAGVARQSSGLRLGSLVAILLLIGLGVAAYLFRDQLTALLPGGGEEVVEVAGGSEPGHLAAAGEEGALPLDDVDQPGSAESTLEPLPTASASGTGESGDSPLGEDPLSDATTVEPSGQPGPLLTRVEEIRSWQRAGETVVTIEGNGALTDGDYSDLLLENPPRLLVKIFGIQEAYRALTPVGSPELRQIRTALHPGNELHIVLDLGAADVRQTVATEGGRLRIRLEG